MTGLLIKGGPVLVVILGLSAISLAFALERFYHVRRADQDHQALMDLIACTLEKEGPEAARRAAASFEGPVAAVLEGGLAAWISGNKTVQQGMEEKEQTEFARLEEHMDIIALTADLAPLLGLLGTVTGMIDTFSVFSRHGMQQPMLLAGGISEALITTAAGLMVAIFNLAVYHYLTKQIDRLALESQTCGMELQDLLQKRGRHRVPTPAQAAQN
ncbi:MAG: MotA/TolQ/ExbB proton channel family protein [Firmicutes bacterium]|nr:MotA/TolQ/ExbB proton channel family protein [Bacillota bacterium]